MYFVYNLNNKNETKLNIESMEEAMGLFVKNLVNNDNGSYIALGYSKEDCSYDLLYSQYKLPRYVRKITDDKTVLEEMTLLQKESMDLFSKYFFNKLNNLNI